MSLHAEGTFPARITAIEYEQDGSERDGLVLCFTVALYDGHETVARHRTHGEYAYITREIVEKHLGFDWPSGIMSLTEAIGREVPVKIKHKTNKSATQTYENAYLAFGGSGNKPAAPDFVKSAVERMSAPEIDDNTPF